jgi:hypothetical protein
MNMKKLLIYIVLLAAATTSCKKYLDTAYKNPNLPTSAAPEQVLQSCISAMHRGLAFDSRAIAFYTQNWGAISSSASWQCERHGYTPGSDFAGDIWRMHYWSMGFNIIDMIDSSRATGKFDYVAAAHTLNAWSWLTTADVHGELPVRQAFEKGRLSFDYDNQDVAYDYAMRYCDSALLYWDRAAIMAAPTLAIGDQFFFKGDQNKWKKFVYGIKARLFHRSYNKANYKADSVIKYANLAMASTTDDAMVAFNLNFADVTARNFFGPSRNNMGLFRIGSFAANCLNGTVFDSLVDPRAKFIMRPSTDNVFRGIVPNMQADFAATTQKVHSFWGVISQTAAPAGGIDTGARTFFKNGSLFPIMTYSEMQFLKSEAAFKKGDKVTAKEAYVKGIQGHFDMLSTHFTGYTPFTTAEKDAFIASPKIVPVAANDLTLRHIMCQKYISLWSWGHAETWVDMRRHEYDTTNIYKSYTILPITLLYPDNGGKLSYRLRPRYNSEYLWNIDALNAVGGFNPDYHTKKVWFNLP